MKECLRESTKGASKDLLHRPRVQDCCNDDGTATNFYADDKSDEIDAVRTHGFGRLEPARWVRIRVSTDLRWIGHDEKCFRFELLGCRSGKIKNLTLFFPQSNK